MSGTLSNLLSQSFSTVKVPNTRLALYTLSIRSPGFSALSFFTYTFPISPGALRKAPTAMSAIYDTSGPVLKNGVKRDVDSFGLAPPIYTLEGTTGWDRHQTDGMIFTGLQSIQQLQYLISLYAQLNQAQKQANNPSLYTLEFYDYFNQEFWQVEPMGEMEISQSERAPTLQYYRLRFAAVQQVSAPLISDVFADPILQLFAAASSAAAGAVQSGISSILGLY
jgi:hypothetical protein